MSCQNRHDIRVNKMILVMVIRTTRYTHKYMALEVSRLGLPANHSGQKTIHLLPMHISNHTFALAQRRWQKFLTRHKAPQYTTR